ncbi:hypothetical protein V2J94_38020 [Streptomyces sp. DSM 41524]|uniref:Uncharacterized protein n=1 Tax=Streptomyces asiaticus subsp. ignotus TaxID=3098222 RepID=A0ABU7Q8J8_9ACTN|nr:hypothetical protein [Streptomyces sp. DSM 41524]
MRASSPGRRTARVAAGRETVVQGLADLFAQQGEAVGGLVLGEVTGGDFEHQLANGEDIGGELVDGPA